MGREEEYRRLVRELQDREGYAGVAEIEVEELSDPQLRDYLKVLEVHEIVEDGSENSRPRYSIADEELARDFADEKIGLEDLKERTLGRNIS